MLQINNLSFTYRKSGMTVFDTFSLNLREGGVYGLLGRNGAGKSTLLYLMAGLLTPDFGEVLFDNYNVRDRAPRVVADTFIVPEEFDLPAVKLSEYVAINAPFYPRFSHDDLRRYLDLFRLPPDVPLHALSMGQKKKAYMSFALATGARLLIMDEPTNGLDIPSKEQFRQFITMGMTDDRIVVISTHQVRDIDRLLSHVTIIDQSRTLLNRSTAEIAQRLQFGLATDIADALYVQPTIAGNMAVMTNHSGQPGPIDLELLFNATLANPQGIAQAFANPLTEQPL